jgi:hypothetical protein
MSNPVFLSIYSDGKLYVHRDDYVVPNANTLLGTFRFNSDASSQLLTQLSGTVSSNLSISGTAANGRHPSNLSAREVV